MSHVYDLTGMRFGSLVVIGKLGRDNHNEMRWLCKCDCGNEHISTTNRLIKGITVRCKKCKDKKAGESNTKHQRSPIDLWYKYQNMKTRCYNPHYELYHRYGGRGITVCDEWKNSFVAFRDWALANGYKKGLTLDRRDNDGDYTPDNCRWATMTEQSNNRSTNKIITIDGESDTLANWVRRAGLKYSKVQSQLDAGKSPDIVIGIYITR